MSWKQIPIRHAYTNYECTWYCPNAPVVGHQSDTNMFFHVRSSSLTCVISTHFSHGLLFLKSIRKIIHTNNVQREAEDPHYTTSRITSDLLSLCTNYLILFNTGGSNTVQSSAVCCTHMNVYDMHQQHSAICITLRRKTTHTWYRSMEYSDNCTARYHANASVLQLITTSWRICPEIPWTFVLASLIWC